MLHSVEPNRGLGSRENYAKTGLKRGAGQSQAASTTSLVITVVSVSLLGSLGLTI
jgi:hypothetical protein